MTLPRQSPNSLRLQLRRAWALARYHRPGQLVHRLAGRIRVRIDRPGWARRMDTEERSPRLRQNPALAELSARRLAMIASDRQGNAAAVRGGRFAFLNIPRHLPWPIDWRLADWPEAPRLWRFHLHYQEYLWDLVSAGRAEIDYAWKLVEHWIAGNRLGDPRVLEDAWHPYCISRRLPVWAQLLHPAPPGDVRRDRVLTSIAWQAGYLLRHLERDIGGNHLLENARALALAGALLCGDEADRWLQAAAELLERELPQQILPHGEHFERSTMYHAQALEGLLETRDALATVRPATSELCRAAARPMAAFLQAVRHPDGEIPLLGDSAFGETLRIEPLLEWADRDPQIGHPAGLGNDAGGMAAIGYGTRSVPDTLGGPMPGPAESHGLGVRRINGPEKREGNNGARDASAPRDTTSPDKGPARTIGPYWVFRDRDDCLIFDAGPVGADHLPAHAHADLLTLEASIGGRRLLVDSGVFDYEDGPMRGYCRSTAAHNVLAVDQADQCDLWSRFRMGYRGHPGGLGTGQCGGFAWAQASHDAYRRLGVQQVSRWIACRPGGPWLCVDWACGRGRHELTSRLHLHPDVVVRPIAEHAVGLQFAGDADRGGVHQADHEGRNPNGGQPGMPQAGARRLRLTWLGPGTMRIATGWYCPRFGLRRNSRVLEWTVTTPLPGVCAWCLRDETLEGKAEVSMAAAGPLVRWTDAHGSTDFNLAGM